MLGKLCFLSLAFPALTSPLIGSWVRTTPTFENVTDTPTIENITDTPTFESVTDTPNLESVTDTPTLENVTDIPTLENMTDTPIFENITNTPTLENVTDTPTFENVTDTPTLENARESSIGGCTFDDNLLVGGNSNESSNDYSAFQLSSAFYWNDNQVPFFFESNMQENDKTQIKKAMKTMQENTCITFFEDQENNMPDHHLAVFIKYEPQDCSQGNGGSVGNSGVAGQLTMSFDKGFECQDWTNLILHELGHVVGLAHTQKRPDRDQFIQVNLNCIEPGQEDQFEPHREDEVDTFGVPYKCNSMMHYGANTFANGCDTMTPQPGQCENGIGGNGPIPEDWELINKAYNC